jgi:hypothetical protein
MGEGDDNVKAHVDWILAADFESLEMRGAATHGRGNAAANRLAAGEVAALLEGLAAQDTLAGGMGTDRIYDYVAAD